MQFHLTICTRKLLFEFLKTKVFLNIPQVIYTTTVFQHLNK